MGLITGKQINIINVLAVTIMSEANDMSKAELLAYKMCLLLNWGSQYKKCVLWSGVYHQSQQFGTDDG